MWQPGSGLCVRSVSVRRHAPLLRRGRLAAEHCASIVVPAYLRRRRLAVVAIDNCSKRRANAERVMHVPGSSKLSFCYL